jgi:hypothetical protein
MPFATLKLRPGVNVEQTFSLNEAGISESNGIRFRNGLAEKLGGWLSYYPFAVGGVPKALHAWQDLNDLDYLGVGTTTILGAIADGSLTNITPQTYTSDINPNFATTASSTTVTITDANIANVTTFDSVEFKTPVAVGGIVLSGVYPISLVLGTTQYQITASSAATLTRANATITAITKANPGAVTTSGAHGFSTGDLIYFFGIVGMTQLNGQLCTITSTGANSFTIGIDTSGYATYTSGGSASAGVVPKFTTTSGSSTVTVTLQDHGLAAFDTVAFALSTTIGGVTISGTYSVVAVPSADTFTISVSSQATSSTSGLMNSGQVELDYYIALGPPSASSGYGIGTYGTGGYGTGSSTTAQTGTPIAATDWSLDNWGQTYLSCPENGGVYAWTPNSGFQNAQLVAGAPAHNRGMFVSMQTQMLICYGSTTNASIGIDQDPLLVSWSAQGDYTDFTVSVTTQAGSRRLPQGSKIIGGMSVPGQEFLWTDLDLWSMNYLGSLQAGVWGFQKIGSNCGLIGKHAATRQGSQVMWMGASNFWVTGNGQPQVIPCTVWDTVFQDLNTDYQHKCWAWSNSPFNEVWWFFPRASTGATEPDAFAKYNIREQTWDYGEMDRTCGIDQSIIGLPIAASSAGIIYEHEVSPDADGQPLNASLLTGWYAMSEGEDVMFLDWALPDMIWRTFDSSNSSASIKITFYSTYYPGNTPQTHGPYTVTQSTQYINPRIRGRLIQIKVESNDIGSFWRLGAVRMRLAKDGRL